MVELVPSEVDMSIERTLRCYDYVSQPFEQVHTALSRDAAGIFKRATTVAAEREYAISVQLRVRVGMVSVATDVHVDVGPMQDTTSSPLGYEVKVFPLTWRSISGPSLFPSMNAKLLVYPLSRFETQLEFEGTYDPPLGVLGDAFDAVVGHRIAEASVLHFLQDVTALLAELAKPAAETIETPHQPAAIG
jgi:hypothetical protein